MNLKHAAAPASLLAPSHALRSPVAFICLATALLLGAAASWADPIVLLNEADFRDHVFACWLGKNIGGTLGMPFEGKRQPQNISFYTNLQPGKPAANDDLDLQLLWLKAVREHDGVVDARILGEYWLQFVPVNWNEYGVGKRNMRRGLLPPLSGEFDNRQWKHSNGAWIRSEIWACLAPGCPALAARMAREDACVDHGAAEGTLAELFTASIESAAFVEKDRDKLLAIGLSMVPPDCQVALAVRAALNAKKAGKDWQAARLDVIKASESTGWFQAPRNVAYTMLGWLYGEGDFGRSLCIAVNCGDDTDCTGATLGSIFGILYGTKGIPQAWSQPIGLDIKTVAIAGFTNPPNINVLTDETLAMTRKFLALHQAPVALTPGSSDLRRAPSLKLSDPAAVRPLWSLSPYQVVWNEPDAQVTLDYQHDPIIEPGKPRSLLLTVRNRSAQALRLSTRLAGLPAGWQVKGLPGESLQLKPGAAKTFTLQFSTGSIIDDETRLHLELSGTARPVSLPLTLLSRDASPGPDDLALASKGAKATSDSEYDREKNCTRKVIDGIIATPENFSNRWHASLNTPHPHWVEIKLPRPALLDRIVVRFADPAGYPVSFQGLVAVDGSTELKPVFDETDNHNSRVFRAKIQPVKTDTFRFLVRRSANPAYPNAAQVSEIELYPPAP